MVVKDKVGRKRYVLARAPEGAEFRDLMRIVRKAEEFGFQLWIAHFENGLALFKCSHDQKVRTIDLLRAEGLETIVTSGTIKGAGKRASEKGVDFDPPRKRRKR